MIEAWLLADPCSASIVGVPSDRQPRLAEHRDPEDFLTSDPDYEIADDEECVAMTAKPRRRRRRAGWVRPDRMQHPKAYLTWLCRDPDEPDCTRYRETGGGASALAQLDWSTVIRQPNHMRYARALLADLADALGGWPSNVARGGELERLTSIHEVPRDRVLRNM